MPKTYDIDIEMTATIGTTTVSNMVVAAVERQTGRQVSDIRAKYDGDRFAGFDVVFDTKLKAVTAFTPAKGFIPMNFDEN